MSESSRIYPRSEPFRPPDSFAEREASLRRWTQILVFVGAALVVFFGGIVFLTFHQMERRSAHLGIEPVSVTPQTVPAVPQPPVAVPRDPITFPQHTLPTPLGMASPAAASTNAKLLEVVGNLTAVYLYQSWQIIGFLADCTEGEVYTIEEAEETLQLAIGHLQVIEKELETIPRTELDDEDKKGVDRCRKAAQLLRAQAAALREYWKKSDKEHAASYHKARDDAKALMNEILPSPSE